MPRIHAARGFSLIELMIGVALGLIVLAALTSFFVSTSANRHEIERTSRQIENGRFAIDTLRNELRIAGFFAELQQTGATWVMPDPCLTDLASMGLVLDPLQLPLPLSGYAADAAMPGCLANQVKDTDVVVVRRFNTESIVPAAAVANQFYYQPSRCATDSNTTPWAFANGGSSAFILRHVSCGANLANLYRYRVAVFYIRDYSTVAGDKIPTLVKLELDGSAISTYPMVEGIQDMRLEYGIDNAVVDGAPDVYKRCDKAAPCTPAEWAGVTAVRVHVLAVNLEPTLGYKDVKVYDMGSGAPKTVGPFGDPLKRHIYAAVISLPNRTGPRE